MRTREERSSAKARASSTVASGRSATQRRVSRTTRPWPMVTCAVSMAVT